ncbi:MAG: nucleoside deaminase [Saprospiraceae bacterium]|jgi:tRNA(adenine34) deaminase|nr:nucleoside deaminase [Saprospiraceae bacterium]MBK6480259.1 nucleoside deaminase [Saprospiraceae bacterium]MBK7371924.1 nucleoside deaminase [Saprospiraceae bacterium]MBK7435608.1 nucleoside deaminase [Saprospiraceae bacterium]MBK7606263.1 nucleoside deaminase [Saprospiraceae bacterium]
MTDQFFMEKALEQALQAYEQDEVPIGAILVSNLHIIGRGQNQTEHLQDITAHAEMIAMSAGFELLGSKYLEDCTLYVTLEPCVMCAGALRWAQIGRIVYGAGDDKYGFMKFGKEILHPKTKLEYGLLESECSAIIKQFFKSKRK